MTLRCIGDVHGMFRAYESLIRRHNGTVQVGDMGIGFGNDAPSEALMVSSDAGFIRGNHDNPAECRQHSRYIPDGAYKDGVMYIGGAYSIDHAWRTPGKSWWADEELDYSVLHELTEKYAEVQPTVMITHDCPAIIAGILAGQQRLSLKSEWASRTRLAFDAMHRRHQPKLWIFGHWHVSFETEHQGTRFVCLDELEYREFEI